MIYFKDGMNCT